MLFYAKQKKYQPLQIQTPNIKQSAPENSKLYTLTKNKVQSLYYRHST